MPYAAPRPVDDPDVCHFYHSIELPELGLVEGAWDLREVIDDYLGGLDYTDKRVLDVGTASGFLTFELEKRGAEVVSFDMLDGGAFQMVPYRDPAYDLAGAEAKSRSSIEGLKNAWWLAHRLLGSKARAVYGDVYDLPADLGRFNVALLGMILGHLRDPFGALDAVTRLAPETLVITNQTHPDDKGLEPYAHFMPSPKNREPASWWGLSVGCLRQMLDILHYEIIDIRSLWPTCRGVGARSGREHCSSIVARRRSATKSIGQ